MTKKMVLAVSVLLLSLLFIACESPCAHGGDMIEKTVKEATCTEAGVVQTICANCGTVVRSTTVDYGGHDWKETVTKATCTVDGRKYTICSRCGLNKNPDEPYEVIKALGHEWDDPIYSYHAPTCEHIGGEIRICQRFGCNEVELKPGASSEDMLDHIYVEETVIQATCIKQGLLREICKNCGKSSKETLLDMIPHDIANPEREEEPSCSKPGETYGICSMCGNHEKMETGWVSHNFSEGVCSVCGSEEPSNGLEYTLHEDSYYSVKIDPEYTGQLSEKMVIANIWQEEGDNSAWLPVIEIEENAFEGVTGVTTISIPNTVIRIGENFIGDCSDLTKLEISGDDYTRFTNMKDWITLDTTREKNTMPDRIWVDYIKDIPNISTIDRATVQVGDEFVDDYDHLVKVFYVADNGNTIYAVDPMGYYNNSYGLWAKAHNPGDVTDNSLDLDGLSYSSNSEILNSDIGNGVKYSNVLESDESGMKTALMKTNSSGQVITAIWKNLDNRRESTSADGNRNTKWFIPSAGELAKIFCDGGVKREQIGYWSSNRKLDVDNSSEKYDSPILEEDGRFAFSRSTVRKLPNASFLALDLSAE